jgi:ADP-ribose pyrophosphatase YjhB (NUDIX family)
VPRGRLGSTIVTGVEGRIEAIYTAAAEALPVVRHTRILATPGVGLAGDRYATGNGFWSGDNKVSRDLTLVEAEVAEWLSTEVGSAIDAGALRRNVVTRGVRLNELVGVRFRLGDLLVEGTGPCKPCLHLQDIIGKPILRPLVDRGGLRANLLSVGELVEGAPISLDVPRVGVGVLVRRDGRYLLGQRQGSRGHGTWSTPGGQPRVHEPVLATAVRELREETTMVGEAPRVIGQASNRLDDGANWRSVFVAVDVHADAEPRVAEPERCDSWGWFEPDELPQPLFAPVASILTGGGYA